MKKLLIAFMLLFSIGLKAQDVTGTWQSADGWKAEWIQIGNRAYAILNVYNYKHFVSGTITGNQIRGQVIRIDVNNNNCRTILEGTWTLNGNSMQASWRALDGNCDLRLDQRGADAPLTRVARPTALPMNTLSGNAFNPNTDVTGSWGDADWFQDGTDVYYILTNAGFKHLFSGRRSGNQITGTQTRVNRGNNCTTYMGMTFTITDANSIQYRGVANDNNCDLQMGWSETANLIRRGSTGGSNTRTIPYATWQSALNNVLRMTRVHLNNWNAATDQYGRGEFQHYKPNDSYITLNTMNGAFNYPIPIDLMQIGPNNMFKLHVDDWNSSTMWVRSIGGRPTIGILMEDNGTEIHGFCYNNAGCAFTSPPAFNYTNTRIDIELQLSSQNGRITYNAVSNFNATVAESGPCVDSFWAFLCPSNRAGLIKATIEAKLNEHLNSPLVKTLLENELNNLVPNRGNAINRVSVNSAGDIVIQ